MESNQMLLLENKNTTQNQTKAENTNSNCNLKTSEQNKNLNESQITTSTSSISVNNKKNLQHTNYKTPKKKIFKFQYPNRKIPNNPTQRIPKINQKIQIR
jgi:hypothetical protein